MPAKPAFDPAASLLTAFGTSHRINLYLIQNLPDEAWRAATPNGKGRVIASIAAHVHNVRLMWLKAAARDAVLPEKLDPDTATKQQVLQALAGSFAALEALIRNSLATDGKIKGFKPDVGSFVGYLIAHEAHHRGQMTLLARQAGHPVSQSVMFGMWEWGTR